MGLSKLKAALAREKGVDYKKIKQKKKYKEAIKNKRKKAEKNGGAAGRGDSDDSEDDDWEDEDQDSDEGGAAVEDDDEEEDDDEDEEDEHVDWQALDESDTSGSEVELEEKIERKPKSILKAKKAKANAEAKANKKGKKEEAKDEEDIPMSDLEDLPEEEREDLVPHTRLTINNTSALLSALNRIAIPTDASAPFATHQSVTSEAPTADGIEDIQDDLARELAFYAQSLDAARRGRALLKAEGVPFSRPTDYFAEMVKDDGHMEKVKAKLIEEASAKKASAEARKLRDLKKFGKQVQE
ncbi:hypothetical protein DL769_011227 [Monosporascus sp. CRB-8-3]|nr:hypothetical protein DL769_011227 [Monosporascus sp. CRB-8-3]